MKTPAMLALVMSAQWCCAAPAHAQELSPLEEGRARLSVRNYEAAIRPLEDAEEEATGEARAEARLLLARAYAGVNERDEQRDYLMRVADDPAATPQQVARAQAGLVSMQPARSGEYHNPLSNNPLAVSALVFAGLEVALLLSGGIVMAETECVNDPVPCSSTARDVGVGLLIAGSAWWIVPTVLSVLLGLGVGVTHTGPALTNPNGTVLNQTGALRF
ncbi:MAG: tol-pal system YbgF family protein [Sandaracinaceae bacterium]